MSHYVLRCPDCRVVIAQCRCPNPAKQERVSAAPCDECVQKQVAAQIFKAQEAIRENMERKSVLDEVARMSGNQTAAEMLDP